MYAKQVAIALALIPLISGCEPEPESANRTPSSKVELINQFFVPEQQVKLARSEVLYVPVYSNIASGQKSTPSELVANLSIRNTDPKRAIFVSRIDYYDTAGKLVRKYLDRTYGLRPMASAMVIINMLDTSGGSGANFIVEWGSTESVNQPIVEAVMVGGVGNKGFSFISPAQKRETGK